MTTFPELPPDPALIALLDTLLYGDDSETHKRCGQLIRRAKALGWIRDRKDDKPGLIVTDDGKAAWKQWNV